MKIQRRLAPVTAALALMLATPACQSPAPIPTAVTTKPLPSPSPPATPSPAVIKIDPAAAVIRAGGIVSVSIRIEDVSDLVGAEVHLSFDPEIVGVIDADANAAGIQIADGDLLVADFVAQNAVDNDAGTIDYAIAQLANAPLSATGALAVIQFRGKQAGVSLIAFRSVPAAPNGAILADRNGEEIVADLESGSIEVK
jgi:hypothetical protein